MSSLFDYIDWSNIINAGILLFTLFLYRESRRSLMATDGPRIYVENQSREVKYIEGGPFETFTVEFKNIGSGVALQVFLLIKQKKSKGRGYHYYLSKPEVEVEKEKREISIQLKEKKESKYTTYLITSDFFGNIHILKPFKTDGKNIHLRTFNKPSKFYSKWAINFWLIRFYMLTANKQGNTYVVKREKEVEEKIKKGEEILEEILSKKQEE
jgi:hypothetical protein